jgi:hypothetical protein
MAKSTEIKGAIVVVCIDGGNVQEYFVYPPTVKDKWVSPDSQAKLKELILDAKTDSFTDEDMKEALERGYYSENAENGGVEIKYL